jgi:hypothetical protein
LTSGLARSTVPAGNASNRHRRPIHAGGAGKLFFHTDTRARPRRDRRRRSRACGGQGRESGHPDPGDVDLAEGSFTTNLVQARASYNFSPLVYLQAFLQYNDDADTWSSNVRFSWLNTAGTGLFIVYNDTEGLGNMLVGPQNRSLYVKYTHQFDILN